MIVCPSISAVRIVATVRVLVIVRIWRIRVIVSSSPRTTTITIAVSVIDHVLLLVSVAAAMSRSNRSRVSRIVWLVDRSELTVHFDGRVCHHVDQLFLFFLTATTSTTTTCDTMRTRDHIRRRQGHVRVFQDWVHTVAAAIVHGVTRGAATITRDRLGSRGIPATVLLRWGRALLGERLEATRLAHVDIGLRGGGRHRGYDWLTVSAARSPVSAVTSRVRERKVLRRIVIHCWAGRNWNFNDGRRFHLLSWGRLMLVVVLVVLLWCGSGSSLLMVDLA